MPKIDITKVVICDLCGKTSKKGVEEPVYGLREDTRVVLQCCWECLLGLQEAVNAIVKEERENGSE